MDLGRSVSLPRGAQEVAAVLEGVSLTGREVLDIGCGLGAVDVLLVRAHHAGRVVGIDVEAPLIERSRRLVEESGLSNRVDIRLVEPGPLPFADGSFDVVFSKESIIHIPDKSALYREILRLLRPGGEFVASDWLRGGAGEYSEEMKRWLDIVGLTFEMKDLEQSRSELEHAGFSDVRLRDRNAWYREEVEREIARVERKGYEQLAARAGEAAATHRRESGRIKRVVVERGELRPTHMYGKKKQG